MSPGRNAGRFARWCSLAALLTIVAIWIASSWWSLQLRATSWTVGVGCGEFVLAIEKCAEFQRTGFSGGRIEWSARAGAGEGLRLNLWAIRFPHDQRALSVPLAWPALLLGIATALAWRPALLAIVRRRRGRCASCGYPIDRCASPERCPECGASAA